MKSAELGRWGEERTAEAMEQAGWTILDRNYRCRYGELDIVARRDDILAFTEVKLRKNACFAEAREFVTAGKQRKLRLAAMNWLSVRPWAQQFQPRFDVAELYAPEGSEGQYTITYLEAAFE
ncbi:MAG: YraN family protein [Oscillospiraceae bacterium]|nr:YraN family protein [Oscillospiraceae bacterium]